MYSVDTVLWKYFANRQNGFHNKVYYELLRKDMD